MPIIDFHSHILPCIDDGSSSENMSVRMLEIMRDSKIDYVVATPHFYCKEISLESFLLKRNNSFDVLKEAISANDSYPKILLGAEVSLNSGLENIDLKRLCIENSQVFLLEMPYRQWTDVDIALTEKICLDMKLTVIFVHFERYFSIQKVEYIKRILNLPVYFQINSGSFENFFMRRKLVSFFESGIVHILGSDSHNLSLRKPNLNIARDYLEKKKRTDIIRKIDENGAFLLNKILNFDMSSVS